MVVGRTRCGGAQHEGRATLPTTHPRSASRAGVNQHNEHAGPLGRPELPKPRLWGQRLH